MQAAQIFQKKNQIFNINEWKPYLVIAIYTLQLIIIAGTFVQGIFRGRKKEGERKPFSSVCK